MPDQERKSAMFTKPQREFLRGEREYTGDNAKSQRYEMRERIARRVRDTLLDFALLYEYADERERNRIFNVGEGITDTAAQIELRESLVGTLAFLYRSLEGDPDSNAIYQRSFQTPFAPILKQAVRKAEVDRQVRETFQALISVEFTVDVTNPKIVDVDHAIDKIAEMREYELSDAEARALLRVYNPEGGNPDDGSYVDLAERVRERREELGVEVYPPREKDTTDDETED